MNDILLEPLQIREQLERLLPKRVKYYSELTPDDLSRIHTPGTLAHSVHPDHLIHQVLHDGRISSQSDEKRTYLRVHVTGLDGKTIFIRKEYPGMRANNKFGAGIVFSRKIQAEASLQNIPPTTLKLITDPLRIQKYKDAKWKWNWDGIPQQIFQEISMQLKRAGITIQPEPVFDSTAIGRLLATAVLERICLGEMDKSLALPIFPMFGGLLGTMKEHNVMPNYPTLRDIQFVILNDPSTR